MEVIDTGALMLIIGWVLYWLKMLDEARRKDLRKVFSVPLRKFLFEKIIEIFTSGIICVTLFIVKDEIPTELFDLKGKISLLLIGYSSSSILNNLLSYRKPLTNDTL